MTNQNETRPMAGTMGGLVGTSVDHSYRLSTANANQRQAPLSAEAQHEAEAGRRRAALYGVAPQTPAQREVAQRAYRRRDVMQRAKTVLRTGGFLLHVAENGVERRLTLKQVWKGAPFLSVWVRDGMEVTFIRNRREAGSLERPVQPRGAGWEFYRNVRGENSTSWRRPVRVEDATTREATALDKLPIRMEGR